MASRKKIDVVVALPDELLGDAFDSTVSELREKGLTVQSVMNKLGMVTGSIAENKMESLKEVAPGVIVRPQQKVHPASP